MLVARRSLDVRLKRCCTNVIVIILTIILIATPDTLPIGFHCSMITVLTLWVVSVVVCW
jgi:hypothetical protein